MTEFSEVRSIEEGRDSCFTSPGPLRFVLVLDARTPERLLLHYSYYFSSCEYPKEAINKPNPIWPADSSLVRGACSLNSSMAFL